MSNSFAICYLSFTIYHLPFVIYRLSFVEYLNIENWNTFLLISDSIRINDSLVSSISHLPRD